jgi:hypothetical protein
MRGKPWLRLWLTAAALALAGIPVFLTTRTEKPAQELAPLTGPVPSTRRLTLSITTAPAARAIGATYLGRQLISPSNAGGTFSGTITLPTGGADLVVSAEWSGREPAALRVSASNESGPLVDASLWGRERLEEVVTIPGTE